MSEASRPQNSARVWWFDLGVVILTTVFGTVGLVLLDAFERLQVFFEVHENSELDEIFLGAGILALSLIWFIWRRWLNSASQSTANLLSEIKLREQAENTAKKSEARLRDAIENIPGGFVLRDADDRVILFNERYREWNADVAHLLKPGVQFESMLRDAMHRRQIGSVEGEDWVKLRLAKSHETSEPFEEQHSDGRWLRVEERRTSDGGYVGVRTDITELKQSQNLLYDAIGTMAEGFALYDSDERMVMCNEPYRETLPQLAALGTLTPGMKMEDILRAGVKAGLVPPVYTSGEAYLTERLERFRNPSGPFEFKTTNGQWIRSEEKKTLSGGTVAIRTNVTERKQAEEALKASEGHLRSVIDNYPFLITLKDLDGRYILVNDAYAKSRNVSVEQAMGRLARDHETSDQTIIVEAHDREVIESRKTIEYERDTILPDGVRVTRAVTKFPTYDDNGELTGVGTISTDVTERKQAEKALRDSENLFKSIIDNVPSTILLKDLEGRLTLVNKRFEEWYGISARAALGKTTHELFPKSFSDIVTTQDRGTAELGTPGSVEADVPFADGSIHKITSTKFLVPSSVDDSLVVATIATDITQQRKSEEQLRQAQKMESIGQLTGGIAHDFNNLLGVIIGNLEFLQESLKSDDQKRAFTDNAIHAALRGAELTQRLLSFARKQTLRPEVVDLNQLVLGMTKLLRRTLGETISIDPKTSADLWVTEIDPAQFEAELLNLVTNARHAMGDGGRLVLETSNIILDQDYADQYEDVVSGPYVMLAVSDTGTGMPEDVLAQAFEPFFTTKEVGEGSGLGLSMVHGFVRQSQGHVSVYSEVGVGTTVKLYFKVAPNVQATQTPLQETNEPTANANETVLIVEDDPNLRQLTVSIISRLGYDVLEAENGPMALALLDKGTPVNLLFTDVILPENMNGAELAAEALKRRPGLKVLYTSGYNENVIVHNGMLDENVSLISKPYRRQELAQRIRAVLDSPVL